MVVAVDSARRTQINQLGDRPDSLVIGRDFGVTTDIETGPDGSLYVVSLTGGAVYRVFKGR